MSLGKLPGIKGLTSGSQEKRRFKSELSVDMISPPLGSPDSTSSSKMAGFFTRAFHHVRKNSVARPRGGSRDTSSPPPDISPIIKNAISLPQLNLDASNGRLQSVLFPSSVSSTDNSLRAYGEISSSPVHAINSNLSY
ncbi:Cdc42 effector protein 1 [Takifugu flavidus]|uniref:Cdc42 effector protein 1 n=1 Tax=Takifugu flavidus TaxID=433684 RepID=A0A5C6MGJ8_9TELE|nr:Cdc42 effector protein 1 [Takifugu flavidus]